MTCRVCRTRPASLSGRRLVCIVCRQLARKLKALGVRA
jgi:hypothetical protein